MTAIDPVALSQALKLKRRHPHVFARDRKFDTAAEVLRHWKEIKSGERALRALDVSVRGRAARKKRAARP